MKKIIVTTKFFCNGVKNYMKFKNLNFIQAVAEEIYMLFAVMGVKLYINYANGTATFSE